MLSVAWCRLMCKDGQTLQFFIHLVWCLISHQTFQSYFCTAGNKWFDRLWHGAPTETEHSRSGDSNNVHTNSAATMKPKCEKKALLCRATLLWMESMGQKEKKNTWGPTYDLLWVKTTINKQTDTNCVMKSNKQAGKRPNMHLNPLHVKCFFVSCGHCSKLRL